MRILLGNLRSVTEADWAVVPPGGARSIRQIVGHVGACKYMYDDHAFGDARMTWDDPAAELGVSMEDLQSRALAAEPPMAAVVEWLREGHRQLREHVAALDDAELSKPRGVNWGEMQGDALDHREYDPRTTTTMPARSITFGR